MPCAGQGKDWRRLPVANLDVCYWLGMTGGNALLPLESSGSEVPKPEVEKVCGARNLAPWQRDIAGSGRNQFSNGFFFSGRGGRVDIPCAVAQFVLVGRGLGHLRGEVNIDDLLETANLPRTFLYRPDGAWPTGTP